VRQFRNVSTNCPINFIQSSWKLSFQRFHPSALIAYLQLYLSTTHLGETLYWEATYYILFYGLVSLQPKFLIKYLFDFCVHSPSKCLAWLKKCHHFWLDKNFDPSLLTNKLVTCFNGKKAKKKKMLFFWVRHFHFFFFKYFFLCFFPIKISQSLLVSNSFWPMPNILKGSLLSVKVCTDLLGSSWNFLARASPSHEVSEPIQAQLGHFNFRAETELTILTICMSKNCKFLLLLKNYNQISQF
jgi:hypothetical protein